jgi:hypothetical protein
MQALSAAAAINSDVFVECEHVTFAAAEGLGKGGDRRV